MTRVTSALIILVQLSPPPALYPKAKEKKHIFPTSQRITSYSSTFSFSFFSLSLLTVF